MEHVKYEDDHAVNGACSNECVQVTPMTVEQFMQQRIEQETLLYKVTADRIIAMQELLDTLKNQESFILRKPINEFHALMSNFFGGI